MGDKDYFRAKSLFHASKNIFKSLILKKNVFEKKNTELYRQRSLIQNANCK